MTQPSPPPQPKRGSTFTSSSHPTSNDPPNPRTLAPRRRTSAQSLSSPSHSNSPAALDRRPSTFSLSSIDELTADLINPSFTRQNGRDDDKEEEVTNWHSTPLLFALLPAVGGVLFKEGAAVVTDLLILGLAAIFLNWSVRLPWDWYFASQKLVRAEVVEEGEGAIIEEDEGEEGGAVEDAANTDSESTQTDSNTDRMGAVSERHHQAARHLRRQEVLALSSTFLFPALAAYLLHILRSQLSQQSTGLVSDYNLCIFLLVAEIRPCRHLIRLIKRRTLHLHRTVTGSDEQYFRSSDKAPLGALTARIEELEHRLRQQAEGEMNGHPPAKKSQLDDLSLEMKRRYESRIDALERAVRRYEKRTTTLTMVTEQRLKTLDVRLSETLSLAAVAAQQSGQRSTVGRFMDVILAMVLAPMQLAASVVIWPVRVLESLYAKLMGLLFGRPKGAGKGGKRIPETKVKERMVINKPEMVR